MDTAPRDVNYASNAQVIHARRGPKVAAICGAPTRIPVDDHAELHDVHGVQGRDRAAPQGAFTLAPIGKPKERE
jgi:hypothetical protein